jgi:putative FmdB family regulatory protein
MPIYEYLCKGCGHEFEREQRITDKPVRTCPKCKARKVQRLISQTSFVLKGGGWYSDLYPRRPRRLRRRHRGAGRQARRDAAGKTEAAARERGAARSPQEGRQGPKSAA